MSVPFFSIFVPTRNRPETLRYCLQTLLHQDFDSYEIIVSDNCDPEESTLTKNVIEELASSKLRYFRPDTVLSMADNYEFALSKTAGDYILCMGDDDGLVVNSLQYVYDFIRQYGADVVKSPIAWYYWINSIDFPHSIMVLPYPRPVTITDSRSMLEKVAAFEMGYFNLPMLYYSFVSRKVIDAVIAEQGNFFQNTASVDMYSGFVVAYKTRQYHTADKPFVIAGLSGKSNGASTGNNLENTVSKEFFQQHNLVEIYKKYNVPLLPKYDLSTFVLLELKKFITNYKITPAELKLHPKKVMLNFLSSQPAVDRVQSIPILDHFRKFPVYREDIAYIEENFLGKQVYVPYLGNNDVQVIQGGEAIDPHLFGIRHVYDASIVLKKMIDSRENLDPIYFTAPVSTATAVTNGQPAASLVHRAGRRAKAALKVLLGR